MEGFDLMVKKIQKTRKKIIGDIIFEAIEKDLKVLKKKEEKNICKIQIPLHARNGSRRIKYPDIHLESLVTFNRIFDDEALESGENIKEWAEFRIAKLEKDMIGISIFDKLFRRHKINEMKIKIIFLKKDIVGME